MKTLNLNNKEYNLLFQGILKLKNVKECQMFFRDLCTITELESMAERLMVAKLVSKEKPYRTINKITGSSTATITRVAQWLNFGMGGYYLVLSRLFKNHHNPNSSKKELV